MRRRKQFKWLRGKRGKGGGKVVRNIGFEVSEEVEDGKGKEVGNCSKWKRGKKVHTRAFWKECSRTLCGYLALTPEHVRLDFRLVYFLFSCESGEVTLLGNDNEYFPEDPMHVKCRRYIRASSV